MRISLLMAKYLLKIFTRDRQAIFFILLLPASLIFVFGFNSSQGITRVDIGVANYSVNPEAISIVDKIKASPIFKVTEGNEESLSAAILDKSIDMVLIVPQRFPNSESHNEVKVKTDSSQPTKMSMAVPALKQLMSETERDILEIEPMFKVDVEEIEVNSLRYIDFVLPGLIAMLIMNISLSGSGSNTVEYRRKGILKRLFVTPIKPIEFVTGVVMARTTLSLISVFLSIAIAVFVFKVEIVGNIALVLLIVLAGLAIFLCVGFTLGSWAKSQQSIQGLVGLVTFPQILLSGIFFPIDSWPAFVQPIANLLPLTFIAGALREVVTNGRGLLDILPTLFGILVWLVVGFVVAARYFVWKQVAH